MAFKIIITCISPAPDFKAYASRLPAGAWPHFKQKLDWDNEGVDRDLYEIAHHLLNWEEKLSTHLELTATDISDIRDIHMNNPALQR